MKGGEPLGLTAKQEKFVQGLIEGLTQRKAYRAAYPNSEKWQDRTVDSKASALFNSDNILARYNELKAKADDEAIMKRTERMIMLSKIASDVKEKADARIRAIDTLNKMDGDYISKVEVSTPDDSSIKEMERYFADKKANS